jgi:hypothetical protein
VGLKAEIMEDARVKGSRVDRAKMWYAERLSRELYGATQKLSLTADGDIKLEAPTWLRGKDAQTPDVSRETEPGSEPLPDNVSPIEGKVTKQGKGKVKGKGRAG